MPARRTTKEAEIAKAASWGSRGFRNRVNQTRMAKQPQPEKIETPIGEVKPQAPIVPNITEGGNEPVAPIRIENSDPRVEGMTNYRVKFGSGRYAEIATPEDITKEEIAKIKKYLKFLEGLNE